MMSKESYKMDMCNGPVLQKVIAFSLPLMLSSCLQLLFNAADVIVVGRFAGSTSLAAVGSTTELLSLLIRERKTASTQPSVSVFYLALP